MTTLKIKRSAATATPASLVDGELAYSHNSGNLFIGDGTSVITIGGGADHDKLAGIAAGAQVNTVDSVNGHTGTVTVTKGDVGLGNVANIDTTNASNITSGTINIARLPAAAIERLVPVADQAARFALTTATVQLGDTVKQVDTDLMYYVVDELNLDSAAGYEPYTAGTASAVPWSGVTSIPQAVVDLGGITGAASGDYLGFDGTNWANFPLDSAAISDFGTEVGNVIGAASIDDLSDVTITTVVDKDVLQYNSTGGVWENVDSRKTIAGTTDHFLRYSGDGFWESQALTLAKVSDVVLTTPATGELLSFDGTNWVNSTAPTQTFAALTDTPADYTGAGGKLVAVNSGATALEFVTVIDGGTF